MKRLIAIFSTVFFVFALTGVNAWATDPKPENLPIDRHASWTDKSDNHKRKDIGSSDERSSKSSGGNQGKQTKMDVKTQDKPWQRVG